MKNRVKAEFMYSMASFCLFVAAKQKKEENVWGWLEAFNHFQERSNHFRSIK